ncbi:dTDP-glucose 4,6-dehydratase [Clostridia bacterium]|nr:dTDP-glucose 4,6-dehydratase [Clostridia bacterium]
MKKVILTGACGFLGSALTKRLLQSGIKVFAVDIDKTKIESMSAFGDVIPIVAKFEEYEQLPAYFQTNFPDEKIDVFYHFAWQGGLDIALKDYKLQLINAFYTCKALEQAEKIGCTKFVFAQTYNYYEIMNFVNFGVSADFEPRYTNIYSAAKVAAELIAKTIAFNGNIEYCSGAVCMTYGENNKSKNLANVVIRKLSNHEVPTLIEGNTFYDLIYVSDVATAFEAIGRKGKNQKTYYVGHRSLRTFRDWISDIRDVLFPDGELIFGGYKDTQNIDWGKVDLDALYIDTGFECTADFTESIQCTANWLREN